MEYTVQELARLAGVTARTLRWYDRIELLRPSRNAENGYRLYGKDDVDRLQQILFYRELGVELKRIREILDDPGFDPLAALREHLVALSKRRDRLDSMIRTVQETILCEEEGFPMEDLQKFEGFKRRQVAENERKYGQEARERYGDEAVDDYHNRLLRQTPEEAGRQSELEEKILSLLESAVRAGERPDSPAGELVARAHQEWLKSAWGAAYSPEAHRSLVQGYVEDSRFRAYYDARGEGCAEFLRDAALCWIASRAE